jgi:ABC transporter, ATP-binding protein
MLLLEGKNLTQTYGDKTIFSQLSLSISDKDKIGLIGINGSGKSTLLKILAGKISPDKGECLTSNKLNLEYLSQDLPECNDLTILEAIFAGTSPIFMAVKAYEASLIALEEKTKMADVLFQKATEEMDRLDGWRLESDARAILSKLGLNDTTRKMNTLSGGERKKVALASALIRPSNLLLLDEPTNHLDYDTIVWLEKTLKEKNCALVLITHDRYFLDRVCNTMLELENGRLYRYLGNYTTYLNEKANRLALEDEMARKKERLYKKELMWMKKGVEARRTKQKARIERFYLLEDSLEKQQNAMLTLDFKQARLGKKIIEIENLTKVRDNKVIFKDFSYVFTKDDAIAILGKNGSGKSTLFDILAHLDEDFTGKVDFGETLSIGYYRQHNLDLDETMTVIDYVREHGEYIERKDGSKITASKMLELFLFSPSLKNNKIAYLSGGEKRRLYLLSILMSKINMLILDEPTNDLDIPTIQVLEDFLDYFPGPILIASHDRYFIDRIANKVFVLEDATLRLIRGGFSDYLTYLDEKPQNPQVKEKKTTKAPLQKPQKLSWQEQKDLESLPLEIAMLEKSLQNLDEEMARYATDATKLITLQEEKNKLSNDLEEKMLYWLSLEEKKEALNTPT